MLFLGHCGIRLYWGLSLRKEIKLTECFHVSETWRQKKFHCDEEDKYDDFCEEEKIMLEAEEGDMIMPKSTRFYKEDMKNK
mmetsp:Transcript_3418/g.4363  ORF Transcript_3418/g.4363 Transcript_3418/m.4363 type:complete len:81 (+) Transcript_3418:38-280(+)